MYWIITAKNCTYAFSYVDTVLDKLRTMNVSFLPKFRYLLIIYRRITRNSFVVHNMYKDLPCVM